MNELPKKNWSNIPFSPRRLPIHYGWIILLLSAVGTVLSVPGQTIGVSVFTDYLIDILALSRVHLSTAYMIGTLLSALLLTHAGKLYDKAGARVITATACLLGGLVLVMLTQVDHITGWLAGTFTLPAGTAAFLTVTAGFFGLRFFFMGMLTMISANMLAKWFDQRRGLAVGSCGVFSALGLAASPLLLNRFMQLYSWRSTWLMLAAIAGFGMMLTALLFFRDNPDECGLSPDFGKRDDDGSPTRRIATPAAVRHFSLSEARTCYSFWIYTLSMAMFGLFFTGLTFHVVSVFEASGMSRSQAVAIFLPGSILTVAVKIIGGWLSDRIDLKYLLNAMLIAMLTAMLGVIFLGEGIPVLAVIIGSGAGGGLMGLLMNVAWPRFFGFLHLGAIRGMSTALVVVHTAIGPYLFGQSESLTGSYQGAAAVCFLITLLLLAGARKADNPQISFQRRPEAEKQTSPAIASSASIS